MKSRLLYFLFIISGVGVKAQGIGLINKKPFERNKYLISVAFEVTKRIGPDWYRKGIIPEVSDTTTMFDITKGINADAKIYSNYGRKYYTVTLWYDESTQKELTYQYASKVDIWEDSGKPLGITFGSMKGWAFF